MFTVTTNNETRVKRLAGIDYVCREELGKVFFVACVCAVVLCETKFNDENG